MAFYSKEDIARAREMDLLTYLRTYEPGELVHVAGSTYSVMSHDSLKISNGKWMWWSRGFGGASALDYLIKVRGEKFTDAVGKLLGRAIEPAPIVSKSNSPPKETARVEERPKLLLPEKAENSDKVRAYLFGRSIAPNVINYCIEHDILYESLPYHNCIFVGYDDKAIARYANFRATCRNRIMGDASGSDKRYSFRIKGNEDRSTLHVFESAIDLLSFASIKAYRRENWLSESMLSLGGVYAPANENSSWKMPVAIENFLESSIEVKNIALHLDSDRAGRAASRRLKEMLEGKYHIRDEPPRHGKDVNDELVYYLRKRKEKAREDYAR